MSVNSLLILCLVALFSVAFSVPVAEQAAPKEEAKDSKDMKTAESLYLRYWSPYTSSYAFGDTLPLAYRSAAYMPYSSYQPFPYNFGLNYGSLDYPWSSFYKK